MGEFIVAIPKNGNLYECIATFETQDAAETFAIKFVDAIVIGGFEEMSQADASNIVAVPVVRLRT